MNRTCCSDLVRQHHNPITSPYSFIIVYAAVKGRMPLTKIFFGSLKLMSPLATSPVTIIRRVRIPVSARRNCEIASDSCTGG